MHVAAFFFTKSYGSSDFELSRFFYIMYSLLL